MDSTLEILQSMISNAEEQKHFVEVARNFAGGVDFDGHEEFKRAAYRKWKLPQNLVTILIPVLSLLCIHITKRI